MLEKMLEEFTRSRPCRSQDNALVEGKNGAVIRKHIGYGHIPGEHAEAVQKFYAAHFNPYLNFHRLCGFATVDLDHKGKRRRRYPHQDYATPYEKFRGLEGAAEYLKPGITMAALDVRAGSVSDTDAGRNMNAAKAKLLPFLSSPPEQRQQGRRPASPSSRLSFYRLILYGNHFALSGSFLDWKML